MWHDDFKTETSAPPGREPVQCGEKWHYQVGQCPACMLARIGSDEDVLFALFAGMVGRMKDRATGTDILRGIVGFEKVKSKRLRFVRYWIKASNGGDQLLFDAGTLGLKMKKMRAEWKEQQRMHRYPDRGEHRSTRYNQPSLDSTTTQSRTSHETERSRSRSIADAGHQHRENRSLSPHDPKLGPNPRPSNVDRLSPGAPMGFSMPSFRDRVSTKPLSQPTEQHLLGRLASNMSTLTVYPDDSISSVGSHPAPLRTKAQKAASQDYPADHKRHDSVVGDLPTLPQRWPSTRRPNHPSPYSIASTRTIMSYDGGASPRAPISKSTPIIDPLDNPLYDPPQTQEQLVDKYRNMLASHTNAYANPFANDESDDDAITLPPPRPMSMYSAFGNGAFDEDAFEGADEELEEDEVVCDRDDRECGLLRTPKVGVDRRSSTASTNWEDLY
ncbi:uncharacterized protein K460DRAFT_369210 [Cucurbitaria berberidis CBS 394.84]|uniref:Uncharacterized protein n=1 Tax=Cucurbitaria berberidis CBS 394.84 TaxID=1168544 RepID=A0A9P4L7H9_9PLEO|nr:uncharacterized protein K460DRAFT_369210 [Cucurbitaria berberidis CBS 394.84]KAF1844342.1 hypothetical protein K460DRAFT_369210 [Cucurbitaria berberidis CBS 394.84]